MGEAFSLGEWLHKKRHSSVFRLEGAAIRRKHGLSEDRARAALKLLAAVSVMEDGR